MEAFLEHVRRRALNASRRRRGPAARARRRRSSARSCAGTATSTPPRTPSRRRCSPPRRTGRATGSRQSPRGWLLQTAERRLIDQWRSEQSRRNRESVGARRSRSRRTDLRIEDDTLIVLFMCCHPALTPASAIALTLRAVGGLTTAEIASAFLVAEATMAQRISRAKQHDQGVRRAVPDADARRAAGAAAHGAARALPDLQRGLREQQPAATLHRAELSDEAIRLTRIVHAAAARRRRGRRPARADAADRRPAPGADRRRRRARPARRAGPGAVGPRADRRGHGAPRRRDGQAARSASTSCRPPSPPSTTARRGAEDTDWPQILALYGLLERLTGNPVVTLNRAVAAGDGRRPGRGPGGARRGRRAPGRPLPLDAVRAHLLELAGDTRGRARALSRRRRTDDEPAGAALPGDPGCAPQELNAIDVDLGPPRSSSEARANIR